ncbi:MAG: iron-containing alcohol dehydrogenase [Ruminococcaceae bacterium]|nr:iron-containing alcohol dehydrogenase [Oscillospiraceae bacterium]
MNNFIYNVPTKIYFGTDAVNNLGDEIKNYGKKVLLCYGGGSIKKMGLYDTVLSQLENAGMAVFELSGIEPNPRVDSVREGARLCKEHNIDVLLAVGGGSTLDATKWIAAAACVDHDAWDFFSAWAPVEKALPVLTVLTLSATGSEMNCGGVISNMDTKDKIGRLAKPLLPKASFLDPTLTYSVSKYQTACGCADIMSHILEVYFAPQQDLYMLDCFMEGLMKTVIKYAPIALEHPQDYDARANLMWTSSWAINGFITGSKQHEWSCHPMEHELSAIYDITHGLGLAILTPRFLKYCLSEENAHKYVQFGINVFDIDKTLPKMEIANKAIDMLSDFFFNTLGLDDTFTKVGIKQQDFKVMAQKACEGDIINGFVKLSANDIEKIFYMCL